MVFYCSLFIDSATEILTFGVTVYIHVVILASFPSSLITSPSSNGQFSLAYIIALRTQAQYNLPFAPKGKLLLVNKHDESLKVHHPLLALTKNIFNLTRSSPYFLTKVTKRLQNFRRLDIYSVLEHFSSVAVSWFLQDRYMNSSSCFSLPLIPLHFICTQQRMEFLPAPFLHFCRVAITMFLTENANRLLNRHGWCTRSEPL